MSRTDLDLKELDFITVGTIGPKGKRIFHLQAGQEKQLVTFTIEKEQAWALSEAIKQLVDEVDERNGRTTIIQMADLDMDLREPIQPLFRVAQMGLAYEEGTERVVLIAQEISASGVTDEEDPETQTEEPSVVRMWATLAQMRALSLHTMDIVEQGRPNPRQNGRISYYWM
jgi:uncharacterized repeat protein (TIGR03847 family)